MTISMHPCWSLLVADACNPNPNPGCLPQLSPQPSDLTLKNEYISSPYAKISTLLTWLSSYAPEACGRPAFWFMRGETLDLAGHDRASDGLTIMALFVLALCRLLDLIRYGNNLLELFVHIKGQPFRLRRQLSVEVQIMINLYDYHSYPVPRQVFCRVDDCVSHLTLHVHLRGEACNARLLPAYRVRHTERWNAQLYTSGSCCSSIVLKKWSPRFNRRAS